jgi:hypothetical protein
MLHSIEQKKIEHESRMIAEQRGEIGPRQLPGWVLEDVEALGNCFYLAVVKQLQHIKHPFITTIPTGTAPQDSLRLRLQGRDFQDNEWAADAEIDKLVRELNVVVAIMDTRMPSQYQYRYQIDSEIVSTLDQTVIPKDKPLVKLACTGNHYLSVAQEPNKLQAPSSEPIIAMLSETDLRELRPYVEQYLFQQHLSQKPEIQTALAAIKNYLLARFKASSHKKQPSAQMPTVFISYAWAILELFPQEGWTQAFILGFAYDCYRLGLDVKMDCLHSRFGKNPCNSCMN